MNNHKTAYARVLQPSEGETNARQLTGKTFDWKEALGNPHLSEFIDLDTVPFQLRETEREILELFHEPNFSGYTRWASSRVLDFALNNGITTILELGAGTAPITRTIAQSDRCRGIKLVPCDLYPNRDHLKALAAAYPNIVDPIFTSVDFSTKLHCPPRTLLVISGAFHHLPPESRQGVLSSLAAAADGVFVCEPLRRNLASTAFVLIGPIFALLAPIFLAGRTGTLRRILFIWLLPIAQLMLALDGLVSVLRMNTEREWQNMLTVVGEQTGKSWFINWTPLRQMVALVDSSFSFENDI